MTAASISTSADKSLFSNPRSTAISSNSNNPSPATSPRIVASKPVKPFAAAVAGADQADKQAVQDRNAAIPNLLNRKDLVLIAINAGNNMPATSAIEFVPQRKRF